VRSRSAAVTATRASRHRSGGRCPCRYRHESGAGRIDGVVKVTGAKLYPSDFRAADLPGWPEKTSHAMIVRVADAPGLRQVPDFTTRETLPGRQGWNPAVGATRRSKCRSR